MRLYSVYQVYCVCGEFVESRFPNFECPHCGRELEIHWQSEFPEESEPEPELAIQE
jgi:predicted RNA-binding Zn-ribbon protein involved in translation (DUF1610 family)